MNDAHRPSDCLARAETLPADLYHGAGPFEAERRAVFGRSWILIGHESEVAEAGDTLAERLAGWPIFVRRGRDGLLRGFHDVCRHRAGPIVGMPRGDTALACRTPLLRCRYHGWIYDEGGVLERTPDVGDATDFDPRSFALVPVCVETWRGFVFVCLDASAPALEHTLGRLPELTAHLPLEAHRYYGRTAHRLRCNWKTYVENYLEGYHIPYIHPRLHREIDSSAYAVSAEKQVVTHSAPARDRVAAPVYDGLWAWLFPNLALNVYETGLSVERMMPVSPAEMRIEYLFFFAEGVDPEAALEMCEQVTTEDRAICEAVQTNLEAGIYDRGRLSPRHEAGVFFFQALVREALERDARTARVRGGGAEPAG